MSESKDKEKKAILTIILIIIISIIFAAITSNYIVELTLVKKASSNDRLNVVFSSSDSSYKTHRNKPASGKTRTNGSYSTNIMTSS